ncbi:hypothetical protein MADA3029_360020 [Vibrio nigripulchritudo MADA3029]|uniref:DUF1868 domain-containing protein n=1 Tax=Vibrio nigripulchritudo TaxID=28173 RepID=UPI0003B1F5B2|nr:DUF1868 domain-containing protein [Vibrio nigripulchritudo]CCN50703.1 hypothetical protein VIBNIMADA3020_970022 [Vibrio nigripulchritudo MADA3020]CCN52274.1 hypothetical protein VIBNIMADA3021_1220023 [Vibrio nigripulchritudo MADA3021]CCN59164.1 hypothetical protein MADA3029_360020 [Vibrio nigripulchritudo MADA3029]
MAPRRPNSLDYLTGKNQSSPLPKAISQPGKGGKFSTDGTVQHWPGVTIVCHIDKKSDAFQALIEMQDKVKSSPFGQYFTYLPPESFHMTVFQCYSPFLPELGIRPAGCHDARSRDEYANEISASLTDINIPESYLIKPTDLFTLHSLTVTGATPEEEQSLRDTRQILLNATSVPTPNLNDYVFHISLAYLMEWVPDSVAKEMINFSSQLGETFIERVSEIQLGSCELCTFDSMYQFDPIKILRSR